MTAMAKTPLRIHVIGAQTAAAESKNPYTVYRTVVTYEEQCYERLLRFSQFLWFYKSLKFRDKKPVQVSFPKRKWSRKSSLNDDVVEERQVKLNEIMKEISQKELAPQSEQRLMKLLKIGPYDDGSGRVSDLSSLMMGSYVKSERGRVLDVVHEDDEAAVPPHNRNRRKSTGQIGATTLVASFPAAVSSSATTVMTEDERSAVASQPRTADFDATAVAAMDGQDTRPPRSPVRKSMSSVTASSSWYLELEARRPQVKPSQSLPVDRDATRTESPTEPARDRPVGPTTTTSSLQKLAPLDMSLLTASEPHEDDASLSPATKYKHRITSQLSTISRLLSEASEAETEDVESTRSLQMQSSLASTA